MTKLVPGRGCRSALGFEPLNVLELPFGRDGCAGAGEGEDAGVFGEGHREADGFRVDGG